MRKLPGAASSPIPDLCPACAEFWGLRNGSSQTPFPGSSQAGGRWALFSITPNISTWVLDWSPEGVAGAKFISSLPPGYGWAQTCTLEIAKPLPHIRGLFPPETEKAERLSSGRDQVTTSANPYHQLHRRRK